jgi:hypothetical protein
MRYGGMVFTPCFARDLKAAGLWLEPKEPKDGHRLDQVKLRAVDGQWWRREAVGELCALASLDAGNAEQEWGYRLFATTSPKCVTKYPGFLSMEERRDREMVWEDWWS